MKNLANKASALAVVRDERGANMVEYLIVLGLVALLCLAGFSSFGAAVKAKIGLATTTVSQIGGAGGGGSSK